MDFCNQNPYKLKIKLNPDFILAMGGSRCVKACVCDCRTGHVIIR